MPESVDNRGSMNRSNTTSIPDSARLPAMAENREHDDVGAVRTATTRDSDEPPSPAIAQNREHYDGADEV